MSNPATPAVVPDRTLTTAPDPELAEVVVSLNAQIRLRKAADQHTILWQQQPSMVYAPADRATLCFDRGGFSAALFQALHARKVYWLTWLAAPQALRQSLP